MNKTQILQVVNKDASRKASIAGLVAQVCMAEDVIKYGTVVEIVLGIIHYHFCSQEWPG